jgi:putative DNA methylase
VTRMIERWFPCAEVSEAAAKGWGSGNAERNLFTWFAARPTAQAKAAVITSLLPWPESESEQRRLQDLVRAAMLGRYHAWDDIRTEIAASNAHGGSVLDPFSGRGMIPLEAARLGLEAFGVDYSPVATLASDLLVNFPLRDWAEERELPFAPASLLSDDRLTSDVAAVLSEIDRRYRESLADYYPKVDGVQPWGYVSAMTLPCQECGRRFPLVGSYELRKANPKKSDPGQSFYIAVDKQAGTFRTVVHSGTPQQSTTFLAGVGKEGKKAKGKNAVCPFCAHVHALAVHQRLAQEGHGRDALLVVAELDKEVGKRFREPVESELLAVQSADAALAAEPPFTPLLPAIPDEPIPLNNGATIRPQLYGATTYGDLCVPRQTLATIRLCRIIANLGSELRAAGLSPTYVTALTGYAAATLVRKLRYSTRGAWLRARDKGTVEVAGIFVNESTVGFSHDSFECGIGLGPGTWSSIAESTVATLKDLTAARRGRPGNISRGSATALQFADGSLDAVVTDPPYDAMVYYSDSSDLFYAWLKRAMHTTRPELLVSAGAGGLQDKTLEVIVKEHGKAPGEHRTREHYDSNISQAFAEMRRVVNDDGLVTIVFGHGEPEVWHRLLEAISSAQLVLTGSWPAKTESGGQQGKANIVTTLTMACRPAPAGRSVGRAATVESEVKAEIAARMALWSRAGLAPTDMLMASAGPAMEVVGRYSQVLNNKGVVVPPDKYLLVARKAVQEAEAVEIDHHPLDTFDARTRFALWWIRVFRKSITAKSELRWQALASDMDVAEVRDLVPDSDKGCRFVSAAAFKRVITPNSPVIDVALAMAAAWSDGLDAVAEVILASGRDDSDEFLWAAISFLADRLPDGDPDVIAWNGLVRARRGVAAATRGVSARLGADEQAKQIEAQPTLFDEPTREAE